MVIELGGQTLFSLDHYGELFSAMMDLDAAADYKDNAGKVLFGSSSGFKGHQLQEAGNAAESRRVCFPLFLTPLMANKYFPSPMSRDRMRIRLEMDTAARGFIAEDAALTDAQVIFSDVKFVQYNLELGADVMSQVAAAAGGSFKIACPSYQHHQASIAAAASSISPTLGFSMSSLNRLLILQQLQAVTATNETIGNRSYMDLERVSVNIGGVKYPQLDIKISAGATTGAPEALAEALISQRSLTSVSQVTSINSCGDSVVSYTLDEVVGNNAANTGKFLLDIDLESQRAGANPESQLVAGVNTIGAVVQAKLDYAAAITAAHVINFYGEHTILLMLDLNTLTFSIAV
jgi:hypothetical protein